LHSGSLPGPSRRAGAAPKEPDPLKRADAAFRAGYTAMQAGDLELARVQFALAARLAPQIPEAMKLWARF